MSRVWVAVVAGVAIGIKKAYDKFSRDDSNKENENVNEENIDSNTTKNKESSKENEQKRAVNQQEIEESYNAHKQAGQRDAPVELGEAYEILLTDETDHHTGRRDLVGKYEGFVIFVTNVPKKIGPGNVANVKITSFNKGGTSAQAEFIDNNYSQS